MAGQWHCYFYLLPEIKFHEQNTPALVIFFPHVLHDTEYRTVCFLMYYRYRNGYLVSVDFILLFIRIKTKAI